MKLRLGRNNGSLLSVKKKIPLNTIVLPPLTPALSHNDNVEIVLVSLIIIKKIIVYCFVSPAPR